MAEDGPSWIKVDGFATCKSRRMAELFCGVRGGRADRGILSGRRKNRGRC